MNAARAWVVAASIGAVEALKDQAGMCRWNYAIRLMEQHAKNNMRSFAQARNVSAPSSMINQSNQEIINNYKMKKSAESMEKIFNLGCWGPNTVRF